MTSGRSISKSLDGKGRYRPTLKGALVSLAIVGSVWVLVVVFYIVLPSIADEAVHRSDREILEKVQRLATVATLAAGFSVGVLTLCLRELWSRFVNRRKT